MLRFGPPYICMSVYFSLSRTLHQRSESVFCCHVLCPPRVSSNRHALRVTTISQNKVTTSYRDALHIPKRLYRSLHGIEPLMTKVASNRSSSRRGPFHAHPSSLSIIGLRCSLLVSDGATLWPGPAPKAGRNRTRLKREDSSRRP